MTKTRKFKKEYANELLEIAKNDFISAETLAANPKIRLENVFFQLQQVVEKSLKAVLCSLEKPVPLVHDIAILIDKLDVPPPFSEEIKELSEFAAIRRYEEGKFNISKEELKAATNAVKEVLKYAEQTIKSANK